MWVKITWETMNAFLNIIFYKDIKSIFQEDHKLLCTNNLFEKLNNSAPCLLIANLFFVEPVFKVNFCFWFKIFFFCTGQCPKYYLFVLIAHAMVPWTGSSLQWVKQFLLLSSLFFPLSPWLEEWIYFIVLERIFSDSFWVQIIKKLPVWNVDFCCLFFFFFVSKIAYYIFQLSK